MQFKKKIGHTSFYSILAPFSTWDNPSQKHEREPQGKRGSCPYSHRPCFTAKLQRNLMNEGWNCKRRNDGSQFRILGAQFKKLWGCISGIAEHSQLQLCQCKVNVKTEAIIYIAIYKLLHKVTSSGKESGSKHLKLNNQ